MSDSSPETGPVIRTLTVQRSQNKAFRQFTDGCAQWWPAAYSWAQENLEHIHIDPREGGRCYERGPHGFHLDWGRVVECLPPERICFTWQINADRTPQPDPSRSSLVAVDFIACGDEETRIELTHSGFERHGEMAEMYRSGMASEEGWAYMLKCFAQSL